MAKKRKEDATKESRGKKPQTAPALPSWIKVLDEESLCTILAKTKKGLFGNPEDKLRADIRKRLNVPKGAELSRDNLLLYASEDDILGKLQKMHEKELEDKLMREAEELNRLQKSKKDGKNTLEPIEKSKKSSKGPKDSKEPWGTQGPEASKQTSKNSSRDKAISDALSRIIKKKGLPVETSWGREGAGSSNPSASSFGSGSDKVPLSELSSQSELPSRRVQKIQQIIDEQKSLEGLAAEKKKKKAPSAAFIKRPFKKVGTVVNSSVAKVAHSLFLFFTTLLSVPIDLAHMLSKIIASFLEGIYKRVGGVSPFGWKKKINQLVIYSGIEKTQEEVTGITIVNGVIFAVLFALGGYFFLELDIIAALVFGVVIFGAVWIVVYSIINLIADKRADEVEAALPDVLQIVSANISAGMTPYNALWVSARKEFGALAEEIKIAQKETLGGKPFTDALTDMGQRVRSDVLKRTVRLIIQGMKAGGELPNILQGIGTDIRQMRLLQKEMAANTMSYVLFILFGMLIGAPLLFSVSIQFVDIVNKFQPETLDEETMADAAMSPAMGGLQSGGFDMMSLGSASCPKDFDGDGIPDKEEELMGLDPNNASDSQNENPNTGNSYLKDYRQTAEPLPPSCITPNYLNTFAMIALFSIGFFGSLLIGLIKDGKQTAGLKLAPVLVPLTLMIFWGLNHGMSFFFKSMFGSGI